MSTGARTIWIRRTILMLVIGLLVAVPVTLLVRSGGGADSAPDVQTPSLGKIEVDHALEVTFKLPKGWRSKREGSVLGLRSGDGTTGITISAPGPAGDAEKLRREALADLRSSFERFQVTKQFKRKIGGLKGHLATIDASRAKQGPSSLLVGTAAGEEKAYLVVVSSAGKEPTDSLVEAQAVLNEIELKG